MSITFKNFLTELILTELISVGDDNVIGSLLDQAKTNLANLKKQYPKEQSVIDNILTGLNRVEQDPNISYMDGYSTMDYLQRLANPKISIVQLRDICDSLSTGENDSGE